MRLYIIYKYTSPSGKCYIGKTYQEDVRKRRHINTANKGSTFPFHNAIRKYGIESFTYEVLHKGIPENEINKLEIASIAEHNAFTKGYNCTLGGEGVAGRSLPIEARKKISEARKGNKDWEGRSHREESKRKISISREGGKNPAAQPVINVDTGEVFACGADAARSLGLCTRAVTKAIRQGTKSGGYKWKKYKENNDE